MDAHLVQAKLKKMRHADWCHRKFGSKIHKYKLNPAISEKDVAEFESRHSIRLPDEYRWFITSIGNGGAGPDYGLEPLTHGIYSDLHYGESEGYIDPSMPFVLKEPWNMELNHECSPKERRKFEEEYFSDKWVNGVLRICDRGCGMSINLVVNGPEYGNLWVDDRTSDYGIYPLNKNKKTTFWSWYSEWLNRVSGSVEVPSWMLWYKDDLGNYT